MNWTRTSRYSGKSGIWTITEMIVAGKSKFILYKNNDIVGRFDTKESAKKAVEQKEGHERTRYQF